MSTAAFTRTAIEKGDRVIHEDRQGVVTLAYVERVERFRGYDDPTKVITFVKLEGMSILVDADECAPFTSASDVI